MSELEVKKGVDKTTGRTVWDKEYYENKAKEKSKLEARHLAELDDDIMALLGEKRKGKVAPPPEERKNLTQRECEINLEEKIGKTQVITAYTPKQFQGGYYCELCECLLKDSMTYMDHINGRRHNKLLGYRMQVDRVDASQVRDKIRSLKNVKEGPEEMEDVEERLRAIRDEEEEKKRRRKEKKKRKGGDRNNSEEREIKKKRIDDVYKDGEKEDLQGGEEEEEEDEQIKAMRAMGLPVGFH